MEVTLDTTRIARILCVYSVDIKDIKVHKINEIGNFILHYNDGENTYEFIYDPTLDSYYFDEHDPDCCGYSCDFYQCGRVEDK